MTLKSDLLKWRDEMAETHQRGMGELDGAHTEAEMIADPKWELVGEL